MGKSVTKLQHASPFLLGAAAAFVCITFYYRSKLTHGGYERSLEAFALINAIQANTNASERKQVASFDDRLISREEVNPTMEPNATSVEVVSFDDRLMSREEVNQTTVPNATSVEVVSFDDRLISTEEMNQTMVPNATAVEIVSFDDDRLIPREDVNQTTVPISTEEVNQTMTISREEVNQTAVPNATQVEEETFPDLLPLLKRVATDDKTVIITSVNEAWAKPNSLLDIFLEGFRIGEGIEHLLNHVIVVTLDPNALNHCTAVHPHCYLLTVDGMNLTSEKVFMSSEYIDLVWVKVKLQKRILELGYNFLFTDVDIIWLRNPFKHITVYADLTTSSDEFKDDPDNIHSLPNTGLIYVKSSQKAIEMMNYWLDARNRFPPSHEQHIFNLIKLELAYQLNVKIQYIDTAYCGGFCNHGNDLNKICTMHANCCIGLQSKLHDLRKVIEDWKFYMTLPMEERWKGWFTWSVPGHCIH